MFENFDFNSYPSGKVQDINPGTPIVINGIMKVVSKKTKTNKDYLMVSITDNFGKSASQLIFDTDKRFPFFNAYVGLEITADIYAVPMKNGSYTNLDITNVAIQQKDPVEESVIEENKISKKEILFEKANSIVSPFIRDTVLTIFKDEDFMQKLLIAPATEYSGYSYSGGLANLIISMTNFAETIADTINVDTTYDNSLTVNPDLLRAGALLSNIGKVFMLEWNTEQNKPVKTEAGILDSELVLARTLISNTMDKLENLVDDVTGEKVYQVYPDVKTEILHIIDSYKNQIQWGAISIPRTKHAMIISSISQMVFAKGLFEELEEKYPNERFSKAYDSGRMYFMPKSYLDI